MNFCPFRFLSLVAVNEKMPLGKGSSISLPSEVAKEPAHPLKRKQPTSFEDFGVKNDAAPSVDVTKNRLIRSNDLLTQTPNEVLLELLQAYAGVKECSDETQTHLFMVRIVFHGDL